MTKIDSYLSSAKGITLFKEIYGDSADRLNAEADRYRELCGVFEEKFGADDYLLFNNPGRTELSGNHTDHNNGCVLAGSVNLDIIAAARANNSNRVTIHDLQYKEILELSLDSLAIAEPEKERPEAIIRGIASAFVNKGCKASGFDAVLHSEVMSGSGLSSSAALEIMIANIFNTLFNSGSLSEVELAQAGRYAENIYFGKPSGLMDQIACAYGGTVEIDFKDPEKPIVKKVSFPLEEYGYSLIIAETGGSHADLTSQYATIPTDMNKIAGFFGQKVCRGIGMDQLLNNAVVLREKFGDRAFLRTMHYLQENERARKQLEAVKTGNINEFLKMVNESGNSSWKYLQNITPAGEVFEQEMAVTLAVTEKFIAETGKGAVRVHGGGFAGTILVFIPTENTGSYISYMKMISPECSVRVLNIREKGAITIPL